MRPGIGEAAAKPQAFVAQREIMADLEHLLFIEIGGRGRRDAGAIPHAGQAVELGAQLPGKAPGFARRIILDVVVDFNGRVADADFADHVPRPGAGGLERQADIEAGNIARQQQVTLGIDAIEGLIDGETIEIARHQPFVGTGIAAQADGGEFGVKHFEADVAAFDTLRRHLHGGKIALGAQDGGSGIADFADDGDRVLGTQIGRIGGRELGSGDGAEIVETGAGESDPDRGIGRIGERTGAAFDIAFDRQSRRRRRCLAAAGIDFLPSRQAGIGQRHALGQGAVGDGRKPEQGQSCQGCQRVGAASCARIFQTQHSDAP